MTAMGMVRRAAPARVDLGPKNRRAGDRPPYRTTALSKQQNNSYA